MRKMLRSLFVMTAVVIGLGFYSKWFSDRVVGKVAPEIEGEDIDGKHFKLSDYRGKVVVLDFWGNW